MSVPRDPAGCILIVCTAEELGSFNEDYLSLLANRVTQGGAQLSWLRVLVESAYYDKAGYLPVLVRYDEGGRDEHGTGVRGRTSRVRR